jgi:dCMP deaminase
MFVCSSTTSSPSHFSSSSPTPLTLEDFVRENDNIMYCPQPYHPESEDGRSLSAIYALVDLVKVHIVNSFESVKELYSHLEATDLLNPARLRPSWDDYFMVSYIDWVA